MKIGVGVSYDTDIPKAMDLMVHAAKGIHRVLENPGPKCQLKNFGDNSIDLELRIWVSDPEKGISNVSSEVRLAIWSTFKEHQIQIPFPQREVSLKRQAGQGSNRKGSI